jgi:hypothetical protein
MKQHTNILMISLALGLSACNQSADRQKPSADKTAAVEDSSITDVPTSTNSVKDLRDDCVRGQAEPIVNKSVFPMTTFMVQPDSLTAIETIDFDNGDKVTIQNCGCEYFILSFRFETSRFQEDTANIPYWYGKAALMASELSKGLNESIGMKEGIDSLISHITSDSLNNYANLKFGQEIDYGGDEIRIYATVDGIEKTADNKFAITMSFTAGPL